MKYNLQNKNNFFSASSRYLNDMLVRINDRKDHLAKVLPSDYYKSVIKETGRKSGNKPSLHVETGLVERVKSAGFGRHIAQLASPTTEDFNSALKKAEIPLVTNSIFAGSSRDLIAATMRVLAKCSFPKDKFDSITPTLAAETQINRSANSGYPHFQKKGNVLTELVNHATSILSCGRSFPYMFPMTRAFRLQLRNEDDNIVVKNRVMYPFPGVITLLECTFIVPFVRHFSSIDTFYVIGKNGLDISRLLKNRFEFAPSRITSTDISAFDQSMLNEPIILAFYILRQQLKLNKTQCYVFDHIVTYFCTSIMISRSDTKEPYTLIKLHGIPSGSCFTNMIGTIAHAIVLEYLNPGIIDHSLICGDDNLFRSHNIDLADLSLRYQSVFNLTVHPFKNESFTSWKKLRFLGFEWINGVRYVDTKLVINQMLWHSSFRTDMPKFEREVSRGASVLLNGKNGKDLFAKIFPDVYQNVLDLKDVRFNYMFGTQPFTTSNGVSDARILIHASKFGPDQSLALHLTDGWMIR